MLRGKHTFASQAQLCASLKLDPRLIKAASKLGADGFNANRSVCWPQLEPWIEAHKDELQAELDKETIDDVKLENAIKDGVLKDLEISQRRGEYLQPEVVSLFLKAVGVSLSSIIKKQRQSLMSKCPKYAQVIDDSFIDIFVLIEKEFEQWK